MRAVEDCFIYKPDISRVTKANSFVASGRIIYVCKKDTEGKAMKVFNAYDKETKVLLASHWDKEFLMNYLSDKDLSVLGHNGSLF